MIDLLAGNGNPAAAAAPPDIDALAQKLGPDLEALLRPLLDQSVRVLSIVVLDDARSDAAFLRLSPDTAAGVAIVASIPLPPAATDPGGVPLHTLDSLAQQARVIYSDAAGDHVILLPSRLLEEMLPPLADNFAFRAVVALPSREPGQPNDGNAWRLQRSLFDHGLVGIGFVEIASGNARCFLVSDAVRSLHRLGAGSRGHITMSGLGTDGRFANQLFQYAFLKLYALRHGLTAALPAWDGTTLFDLDDPPYAGKPLPKLQFAGFSDDDRVLWDKDDPPIDIDVRGYFQLIPDCWRRHRPFLRRIFQLSDERRQVIDAWHADMTRGGQRTLVAVHVRRGDYRRYENVPWLRLVPVEWYLAWLRTIWPTLCNPCLFVATDEPDTVLPAFAEFDRVSPALGATAQAIPDYVSDFELLRRADYLAIGNSSFSRMAAILAPSAQRCFLPSFQTKRFIPYQAWLDHGFWSRFSDGNLSPSTRERIEKDEHMDHRDEKPGAPDHAVETWATASLRPTFYFDATDLILYLRDHRTLSGIQRVQCEILRNLLDVHRLEPVRLIVLRGGRGPGVIRTSAFLDIIEQIRSHAMTRADLDGKLGALLSNAVSPHIQEHDIFLTIGAFWGSGGIGQFLQALKNSGVIIGVYIHDIISVSDPEYFNARDTKIFVKGLDEALNFADFLLTTSEFNKASLIGLMAGRNMQPLPVDVVPLAHELSISEVDGEDSSVVASITNSEYVLCVGTIEVRKNPTYLFNIWKLMVRSGRATIPTLVLAGRKGWLVHDFMEQLKSSNALDGRIVVLHDATDSELAKLYRKCLLTIYPSLAEGWGLPVGESLAYGKITIASRAGGIPEVGGMLVDYINPYNAHDGLATLSRYLDDPELRRSREQEIARHFDPRPWRNVADNFLNSAQALARQVAPFRGVAAIRLPPNRYLQITSDPGTISPDGLEGELSADLICVSGWHPPDDYGVWADEPTTLIRFRTDAPVGARIHLMMRLTASSSDLLLIRISSGSGAETEVSLSDPSDKMVILSCQVEPGQLVSAHMTLADPAARNGKNPSPPSWGLRGILYLVPDWLGGAAPQRLADNRSTPALPHKPVAITPPEPSRPPEPSESLPSQERVLLRATSPDESRRADSFGAFLDAANSHWVSASTTYRTAPIFADHEDRQIFYNGRGSEIGAVTDQVTLIRRSEQYVSMSRFTEGSVFDRSGVSRAFGYLRGAPPAPWLSPDQDGVSISEASLAAAPYHRKSHFIFYNGNLHNYYHWMCEGLLSLDVLSRAMGPDPNLTIALPKSMDIAALLDHRESLRAVGLDGYNIIEVGADLMKVEEAIWAEPDLVQSMPAAYLQNFQRRVFAHHAGARGPKRRRVFVARKGPTRMMHNLEEVEALLARHDFETVYLEGMRVVDQILLFQSAEFVISTHGAGLTNLLFCAPGTKVIEFMPSVEMRVFFWLIAQKLDLVYGVQFCAPTHGQGFQDSITVDVAKLEALYRMVDAHR